VERNVCSVCGHTKSVIKGRLECSYCLVFYNFDIAKEWLEHIYDKEHEEVTRETTNRKTTGIFKSLI